MPPRAMQVRRPGAIPRRSLSHFAGLGGDFNSLNQIPEFSGAWTQIQSQLSAEGASALDVQAAKDALAETFSQLTSGAAGFGLSAADALDSAKTYVTAGRTVLGAVTHIQGLLSAAQGATDPAPIFKMFTGTLIGVAVAAGALSAGIGAVIVTGVAIALDLLDQVGLFGHPETGTVICADWRGTLKSDWTPKIQVGCVISKTADVIPTAHSPNWRTFPKPSGGAPGDSAWYTRSTGEITWRGDRWNSFGSPPAPPYRLIDAAFPDYRYLECTLGRGTGAITDFVSAFFQAWIANKEYELNGLKSQPDWQVLAHLVRVWNRAHDGSGNNFSALAPIDRQPLDYGAQALVGTCPPSLWPFFMGLIREVVNNAPDGVTLSGEAIVLHTGAIHAPPKHLIGLHLGPSTRVSAKAPARVSAKAPSSSILAPSTTSGKVALGTVAVAGSAIVAGSLYAFFKGQAIDYFWGKAFEKVWKEAKGLF